MKLIKHLIFLGCLALTTHLALAQGTIKGVAEKRAHLLLKSEIISFDYLEVRDTQAFRQLMSKLNDTSNYPLSIVKKPVFDPLVKVIQNYDTLLDKYQQLDKHHTVLDSINKLKIAEFIKLDSLQNKRIENFKTLTDEMRLTNGQLNDQLTRSLIDLKNCNAGAVRKKLWPAVLGGAVGFSVATLIALLAK